MLRGRYRGWGEHGGPVPPVGPEEKKIQQKYIAFSMESLLS